MVIIAILIYYSFVYLFDQRIREYQNELIKKQYEEVEQVYQQIRGWRHDYHNHIQTMKAYLMMGEVGKLEEYFNKLDNNLMSVENIIKTGNVMVDAILNSKISLAKSRNIRVEVKAIVPVKICIADIDLSLIIGNLMDNAVEACEKVEEKERFIRIYIDIIKGQLYIYILNSVRGRVHNKLMQFGRQVKYLSTKDPLTHGFGLLRVDKVVKRYQGYIDRQDEENVFATEIMLPIIKSETNNARK